MIILLSRKANFSNLMAVSKQPIITPETSSAEGLDEEITCRGEAKWKRFHPFRVVRKIFRRRIKREGTSVSDESKKSWSTSELQSVQDDSAGQREVTSPLKIGLSVSHDSIFSPETNAVSNETLNIAHGSSLSVHHKTIKNMFKDELFTRVRARRDSDEDAGLPQSPCTSPTTVDILTQGLKEKSKKPQTTYSASSLRSMGSSENDEDSACQSSAHSSRMSLTERRSLDSDGDTDASQPVPLNHNAAHHKISVRPKRTYGLPRRRMNQINAAKVSTLPSTPEVTEDSGKHSQKLEVIKTFTEFSTSSLNEFCSSKQSSEWKVSQMTSSFSYSEVSDLAREVVIQLEKPSFSESQIYKEAMEENLNDVETKPSLNIDTRISEVKGTLSQSFSSKDDFADFASREEAKYVSDSYENSCNEKEEGNSLSLRNENHEIPKMKENETSLKVTSLIRNLAKSENLLKEKEEESCQISGNDSELSSVQMTCDENSEIFISDLMKENLLPKIDLDKTKENFSSTGKKSEEFVKEVRVSNQLDIDSEFVLKTAKRDDKENPLVSSLYFEEESLMSSKSLSMGIEESGIFVSHHASTKDRIVTEARNFAAVEENAGILIPTSSDDSWVSPTSISINADVTVSSSTSTVCTAKRADEKITISVNAKPKLELDEVEPSVLESDNAELSLKQDTRLNEKHPTKPPLLEPNSMKTAQKRVSVEIVPFSQRMKERKYQPISFGNKDQPSDTNKKSSNLSIERKLSDRKVPVKNKELDKPNNRHSFSGALLSDNKKTETVIEKKVSKADKMPVQIRIHKSIPKPEIKDKVNFTTSTKGQKNSINQTISSEGKLQDSKILQNSIVFEKEEALAKWEVKIQPSVPQNDTINIADDGVTSLSNEMSIDTRCKSPVIENENLVCPNHREAEFKSNENSKKNAKEATGDPEPELLRVFARRSIKQKHCDKGKTEEPKALENSSVIEKSEENNKISISDNSTVIKIQEISKSHIKTHDLKKKTFCEKLADRSVSPMNSMPRESLVKTPPDFSITNETIHPRQRLASVPDLPLNLPPESSKESDEEILQKSSSTSVPVASQDVGNEKSPSWLQLAQQRRELREQRERLLLGGSQNSFMDASNKPSRSSKVWDMVNNFQKLQMT